MAGFPKFGILQKNGEEYEVPYEYLLEDVDVRVSPGTKIFSFDSEERLETVTFYSSTGATPPVTDRVATLQFTYNSEDQPLIAVWTYYDTDDGTTILKTSTTTFNWSGDLPSYSETVET